MHTNIFPNFRLYLTEFRIVFCSFNGRINWKKDLQLTACTEIWEKKWWRMSVVLTSFSNDQSAHPATLLKQEFTTDIFTDQVQKFQNSCFKEYLWQAGYFKSLLWDMLIIESFKKHFHWSSPKYWIRRTLLPDS